MKIFTKLGLNAMVAFAMMFATSASVVAQERVVASDSVEVVAAKAIVGATQLPDTYFEFTGTAGQENDPTKWTASSDGSGCPSGSIRACKAQLKGDFLLPTSPLTINPALLPSGQMPVTPTSGGNSVPDPAFAGSGSNQPYVSIATIHNRL